MTDGVFPVCSPALLRGPHPLRTPADLTAHTLLYVEYERSEWLQWLDAAGVQPAAASDCVQRGLIFDVAFMALEAAIGGLGVALGYSPYVEADIRAGRLVTPFELSLPCSVGFDTYIVYPERLAQAPDLSIFRNWLLRVE